MECASPLALLREKKMMFTTALNLTFSPGEKE
jgi:hypothetical protein